ncbi:HupE/UreJ family protein [Candidatus Accumulibacter sp. ACC003]|uniref:HupE/UreJ family protein n=1 Tax=Candidatus Accumulibacter sp. ACC003 TaxID=2823334 RepID=UPI0025C35788|nr:HupE/UreJ family protein [Candidatus Accumulibacter sp. ACC003]
MNYRRHLLRTLHFLLCCHALPVLAHKASDSYLVLEVSGSEVKGQWDIALRDIDFALGLDADGNGEITWGELRARHADIADWALARLSVRRGGACQLRVADHLVDTHSDGAYAVLRLAGECPRADGELRLDYRLLFELDALHRGLLRLRFDGTAHAAVFAPDRAEQRFVAGQSSRLAQFGQYLVEGIWHIWIGFDHILFLLALLLPAVLVHEHGNWRGVRRFRDALREVLWVVTAFTVAHSITLSLAALGLVQLPSRLVESAIAASVVLAAANNLKPVVEGRRWLVAFAFGLIHGFGFASVLAELGLPRQALVLSLLGFNVGVEIGQLAIVAVFLPLAYRLRNTAFYRRGVFVGGSLATLAMATIWLLERAFDLKLIGT